MLGGIERTVERWRHRILVCGICLAVRVGRQGRHIFGNARTKGFVACTERIADKSAGLRAARRNFQTIRDHNAHHGVSIRPQLGNHIQFGGDTSRWRAEFERHRIRGRKIVRTQRCPVRARAK